MSKAIKRAKPSARRSKTIGGADQISGERPSGAAATPSPATRPSLGALSSDEQDDLNSKLAPALRKASHFDALWSAWGESDDYVAATAAGIAAAAARAAVQNIHAAWFAIRRATLEIEGIDHPLPPPASVDYVREGETRDEALDRLATEIKESDAETLASLQETLRRWRGETVDERVNRIRRCPEWSNPRGILHNHPLSACVVLFRALVVSPPVYMDVRGELSRFVGFRRNAIEFRQKVETLEQDLRADWDGLNVEDRRRLTFPGLTPAESEQFRDSLDAICAGDVRTRHGKDDADRVSTVRLIAEHFRCFLDLSRTAAAEKFGAAPWSSGIAALARAALGYNVGTDEVRGALKNWASD